MTKLPLILISLCIGTLGTLSAGPKKDVTLEDLKKIVTGNGNPSFFKSNVYAYRNYKDTLNKYKNSDDANVKEQIALAKREKAEADAEVPGWNNALQEVKTFVQNNSGSKKVAIIKY